MSRTIIDVREKDEFQAEHIEHSISIPLSEFPSNAAAILNSLKSDSIDIMCRSGKRAELARQQIASMKLGSLSVKVYEGGILEWKAQGHPTIVHRKMHFPIMRQVQIFAGFLVLLGVLLHFFIDTRWIYLSGFIGVGLVFAGISGFCRMAHILMAMPWNKKPSV